MSRPIPDGWHALTIGKGVVAFQSCRPSHAHRCALGVAPGAVLGIGRIARRAAVVSDQVVPRDLVKLSLTFDHRIVDGASAPRFLHSLVMMLAHPGAGLTGSSDVPG